MDEGKDSAQVRGIIVVCVSTLSSGETQIPRALGPTVSLSTGRDHGPGSTMAKGWGAVMRCGSSPIKVHQPHNTSACWEIDRVHCRKAMLLGQAAYMAAAPCAGHITCKLVG